MERADEKAYRRMTRGNAEPTHSLEWSAATQIALRRQKAERGDQKRGAERRSRSVIETTQPEHRRTGGALTRWRRYNQRSCWSYGGPERLD